MNKEEVVIYIGDMKVGTIKDASLVNIPKKKLKKLTTKKSKGWDKLVKVKGVSNH